MTTSTKTASKNPEAAKLKELSKLLREATARRQAKETEVSDFAEALRLIEEKPRWAPQPGELPVFDRLQEIQSGKASEAERLEQLRLAKEALAIGQSELAEFQAQEDSLSAAVERQEAKLPFLKVIERLNTAAEEYMQAYDALRKAQNEARPRFGTNESSGRILLKKAGWKSSCSAPYGAPAFIEWRRSPR